MKRPRLLRSTLAVLTIPTLLAGLLAPSAVATPGAVPAAAPVAQLAAPAAAQAQRSQPQPLAANPKEAAKAAASCTTPALHAAAAKAKPVTAAQNAEINTKLAEAGEKPENLEGMRLASCIKVDDKASGGAIDKALARLRSQAPKARKSAHPKVQEERPIPQWCVEHALQGWWGYRRELCRIGAAMVLIYVRTPNGQLVYMGSAQALHYNFTYASEVTDYFNNQFSVERITCQRLGCHPFSTVTAGAFCKGDCKLDYTTPLRPGRFIEGIRGTADSGWRSLYTDGIGHSEITWEWQVNYPGAVPSIPSPAIGPDTRCDGVFEDDGNVVGDPKDPARRAPWLPGCVFPLIIPTVEYSKTPGFGEYPEFAKHVEAAQQSGLPGAPGKTPLTRLQNRADRRRNGDRACPQRPTWERPPGKSCDEYPFRSTHQGAFTQTPQGSARTFAPPNTSWCEMDPAWGIATGVTGSTGWSSCMLDAGQNSDAGTKLGLFYFKNRVLDGDPFHVRITQ
ncbi:hypothetical protein GCM10022254_75520 [Actinomadura meridiana]|uniref:Uncharacterized protein n=1 Tax=Actinomadura meridiana TaxID=559626 RepID=A0ABP8CRB3_9ACTN